MCVYGWLLVSVYSVLFFLYYITTVIVKMKWKEYDKTIEMAPEVKVLCNNSDLLEIE